MDSLLENLICFKVLIQNCIYIGTDFLKALFVEDLVSHFIWTGFCFAAELDQY